MNIILLLHLFMLTFTFGHVELLTVDYHSIDTPIEELNNHTLREVFEDGNMLPTFDNWIVVNSSNNIIDGVLINTGNGDSNDPYTFAPNIPYLLDNVYYSRVSFSVSNDLATQIRARYSAALLDLSINNPIKNTIYDLSGQYTSTTTNTSSHAIRHLYIDTTNATNSVLQIYYDYNINQTALGISSLTVEQMDYWFNVYQENISADDVTYVQNEMTITDLTYILGFSLVWVVIIWSIRKVVL